MSAHNPTARAAAVGPVDARELAEAAPGRKAHDPATGASIWLPVQGPHLRVVRQRFARNRTGCPGISFGTNRFRRKDGSYRVRRFFFAQVGKASRKFCIDTLGREEAWRRALCCRAAYERNLEEANRAILAAREINA